MAKGICIADECTRPLAARGLCAKHYNSWAKTGQPAAGPLTRSSAIRPCKCEGCDERSRARGMCIHHYNVWKRHGDPGAQVKRRQRGRVCSVPDCGRKHLGLGYCRLHYKRFIKTGSTDLPETVVAECVVEGCGTPSNARGLCSSHYMAWWRYGDANAPIRPRHLGPCDVAECDKPHESQGFCRLHYKRWLKYGTTELPARATHCEHDGCDGKRLSRGLCNWHYVKWRDYGLTPDEVDSIYEAQGGKCPVCLLPFALRELAVDHNHQCCDGPRDTCGECVRGLLCRTCNAGLGLLQDDLGLILSAAAYIERTSSLTR